MPILYGEGHRAFQRLQEEIMRRSTDTSLFAWGLVRWEMIEMPDTIRLHSELLVHLHGGGGESLLAESPSQADFSKPDATPLFNMAEMVRLSYDCWMIH